MSTEENKAVIRRWFKEVINGKNPAVVDELAAPDYMNPLGYDRAGLRASIVGLRTGIPDARLEAENLVAEGDVVVARYTMTGTHTGSMMGETPTGKKFSTRGMSYFRLANGKIVEDESIATPDLAEELGIPLPSAATA
jgi:predicted ester cyclase